MIIKTGINNINTLQCSYIMSFEELVQDENYQWGLYFYRLESKEKRSRLEEAILTAYHRIKHTKPVEMCCCDTTPIKNCGPECCEQVKCVICATSIRICKDSWFCQDNQIYCVKCNY
jgi:hypothetical protein